MRLLPAIFLVVVLVSHAPFFNLHQVLWSIPGFSFLRAPGRFTYLVVFACAGLTALALHPIAALSGLV